LSRNQQFLVVLFLGLAVRLLLIHLPGTEDMRTNQIWGAWAEERGITRVYVFDDSDYLNKFRLFMRGAPIPVSRVQVQTSLGIMDHVPDYPPLSLYIFWLASGLAKVMGGGQLQAGALLNVMFNVLPVLCSLGVVLLARRFAREEELAFSTVAVAAFWLNPALILHTPVLGYVDAVFALLGLGSLIGAYRRQFTLSVILLALACMTKPQAVLIIPIVAVVIWAERSGRLLRRTLLMFGLFLLLPFLPFILTGHFLASMRGIVQVAHVGYLSSQQTNLWWIATWIYGAISHGTAGALASQVTMLRVEEPSSLVLSGVRLGALLMWIGFIVLNLWWLRQELERGNRLSIFWAAAVQTYGFTMLSLYPKENHLYAFFVYALPLLFLGRRELGGLYATLSLVFGMNMFLIDGFGRGGEGPGHTLRMLGGFDLTLIIALGNVVVFAWLMTRPRWLYGLARNAEPSHLADRA